MTPRLALFLFLGIVTVLRLVCAAQSELSPDEAYYYMWSERPDLAYYSKGPGVALAIQASTALFGTSELGVRAFSPLLALGTSLLLFYFARALYGESVAVWTVLGINAIPIFNVGGLVMTIDPLSIFFWAAALFSFWLAVERSPRFSWYWPLTGALVGAGFLCKYTNAMQLVSVVLLLAITPKLRREFSRPGFYAMLAAFVPFTIPPIIWNARHEWITLAHLRARGSLDIALGLDPREFLKFFGSHLGVYSPFIFVGMLFAIWWGWGKARTHFTPRFLLCFSLPLLAFYFGLSFREAGEANWTAPAFISLGVLACSFWHEEAGVHRRRARLAVVGLAVGLVMSAAVMNTDLLRLVGISWPYSRDPGARLRGWKSAALAIDEYRRTFEAEVGQPVFLIANKYQTAASLAFYLPDPRSEGAGHPPVYLPESQDIENQFSFWPRYDEFIDAPDAEPVDRYHTEEQGVNPFLQRTALYITDRAEVHPPSALKNGFERVEMVRVIEFRRRDLPLRSLRIFACYNYRSLPL